jgi:hypothetical protein
MIVTRRSFLETAVKVAAVPLFGACDLLKPVTPVEEELLTATVDMPRLAQAIQTQQCEQWCWAASISMIFAYHGYSVSQTQIVAQTYGSVVCLPALVSYTIGADLSRPYLDAFGRRFVSQVTAAFDPQNGIYNLTNAMIVNELSSNRPLLYCNKHHAMVLYEVTYTGSALNPTIRAARVVDPWPFTERTHRLTDAEMYMINVGGDMTFLAATRVTPLG